MTNYNPRYVRYAEAHGNTPEKQMEADRVRWPGGCMCGFILWTGQAWADFLKPYGGNKLNLPCNVDSGKAFDAFLITYDKAIE